MQQIADISQFEALGRQSGITSSDMGVFNVDVIENAITINPIDPNRVLTDKQLKMKNRREAIIRSIDDAVAEHWQGVENGYRSALEKMSIFLATMKPQFDREVAKLRKLNHEASSNLPGLGGQPAAQ
jgi:hypothetical protein